MALESFYSDEGLRRLKIWGFGLVVHAKVSVVSGPRISWGVFVLCRFGSGDSFQVAGVAFGLGLGKPELSRQSPGFRIDVFGVALNPKP